MQQKDIIRNILNLGYSHINALSQELTKLALTPEEIKENSPTNKRLQQAQTLVTAMTIVSDVIHPGFSISLQLMDQKSIPFITQVMKHYQTCKENGTATQNCPCCGDIK